ncbi:MAG: patatin-like phospholipase family protein [Deinococcus sp.]|nr:patatin-like phospholipase family protein [Deinococcus sp.]MCL5964700.1 patatin-like phospholipase family protein [Deinococcus sp.]
MGIILALGGGGVRGMAHLGFLRVLRKEGIPIMGISGSSAGALAAAIYAFDLSDDPELLLKALYDPDLEKLFQSGMLSQVVRLVEFVRKPSLTDADRTIRNLRKFFGDRAIEESPIPIAIQAADLVTGEAVWLREGLVAEAVRASSAVPSIFPPVHLNGRILVDGDVAEKVPVSAAKELGQYPVVAVDISNPNSHATPRTALEAALQAGEASRKRLLALALERADLVVSLSPESHVETFDYRKAEELFDLGMRRAKQALPKIRALTPPEKSKAGRGIRQLFAGLQKKIPKEKS